jgi:hypothetical protein
MGILEYHSKHILVGVCVGVVWALDVVLYADSIICTAATQTGYAINNGGVDTRKRASA